MTFLFAFFMYYTYQHSLLGGTFDRLHKGHKNLLDQVFRQSRMVTIGIAKSNLFQKKTLFPIIEGYDVRVSSLKKYLLENGYQDRAKVIPIDDIYGNSLVEKNLDAIFISATGVDNANLINSQRIRLNYPPLKIIIIPLIIGATGTVISSTAIRLGEIDREGNLYEKYFENIKELRLPDALRPSLKKPFGRVLKDSDILKQINRASFIICVGDIVTANLVSLGIQPDISLFDFQTKRIKITDKSVLNSLPSPYKSIPNSAGTINSESAISINRCIKYSMEHGKKLGIKVIGEEDLLTLPSILFAPLGTIVIYGMRDIGMIGVNVTEHKKSLAIKSFLDKFDHIIK